jgi:hypothetical protein
MTRPPAEVAAEALLETNAEDYDWPTGTAPEPENDAAPESPDTRAAVERNNDDGSVDVPVALRVKVSNTETQNQQTGYRSRVKMTPADGRYKISKLDQVAK